MSETPVLKRRIGVKREKTLNPKQEIERNKNDTSS
jgi:hypothetical protein